MYKPFRDRDYTPWSFVLPVAVGVFIGGLLVKLVTFLFGLWFAGQVIQAGNEAMREVFQDVSTPTAPRATNSGRRSAAAQVPVLDGPRTARSMGEVRACVAGYLSYDEGNGWSQHTNGGRRPCTARSP